MIDTFSCLHKKCTMLYYHMIKNSAAPLVSIGLVVINREQFIERALKTLLGQSYKNIELIISDSSTDNTGTICCKYAKIDKRVKYIKRKTDTGLADNHNIVLKRSKGEYFMWAADDDYHDKDFIRTLLSKIKNNEKVVLSLGAYYLFNEKKMIRYYLPYPPLLSGIAGIITFLKNPGPMIFGIFRKKVLLEEGGFFTTNSTPVLKWWGSDYLTVFRILMRGDMVYTNKLLYFKYDSLYFSIGDYLKNLDFSQKLFWLVKNNLLGRTLYVVDFYYMVKRVSQSSYSFNEKMIIYVHCVLHLITFYFNYLKAIIVAIFNMVTGIVKVVSRLLATLLFLGRER